MVSSARPWLDFFCDCKPFFQVQQASPKGCSGRNFSIGASPQAPAVPCLRGLAAGGWKNFFCTLNNFSCTIKKIEIAP